MITYHAGKSDCGTGAGCVDVRMRFGVDDFVILVLSPKGARMMARNLMRLADEAEAWVPEDAEESREEARDEVLDRAGVARVEAPKAKRNRRRTR